MVDLARRTDRAALDAARSEGRTEGAEMIRVFAARWLLELERIAEREFTSDAARDIVARFVVAFDQTLSSKLEQYRRDQARAIAAYVDEQRATAPTVPQ
jgi:hypothetical protein